MTSSLGIHCEFGNRDWKHPPNRGLDRRGARFPQTIMKDEMAGGGVMDDMPVANQTARQGTNSSSTISPMERSSMPPSR
jgi:hypothetical protein